METNKCSIEGCESQARAKGLCKKHHTRLLRHGDPLVRLTPEGCDESRICSVAGCGRPLQAKGLCGAHYARQTKGLALDTPIVATDSPKATCSVDGCDEPANAKGLCLKHYTRARRHGGATERLKPEGRQKCSVSGCDRNCKADGLCRLHSRRLRVTGDPEVATVHRDPSRTCSFPGCDQPYCAKGLCMVHYQQRRRHGTPLDKPKRALSGDPAQSLEDAFNWNSDECLEWKFYKKGGYARISPRHYGSQNVCRIICERVYGPAPSRRHEAAHSCGNGHGACINPNHLSWKTPKENGADKKLHKREHNGRGSKHFRAKLTEDDVRTIRSMFLTTKQTVIAKHFGVDHGTINAIARGRSWAWLK